MPQQTPSYYDTAKLAAQDAAKASNEIARNKASEDDIQKAVDFANKTLELANSKGYLKDAPDLVSKKEWVKLGANAAFAIGRLAATSGTDVTAWIQLGVSIGAAVSNVIKIDKALKERTRVYTELSNIYPTSVMICPAKGDFNFSDGFTDCSSANQRNQWFLNGVKAKGEQYIKAWQAASFLIYASTVRNESGREKIMFGYINQNYFNQGRDRNDAHATMEYYKRTGKHNVKANGDIADPEDFLKILINPNSHAINAERQLACAYHAAYMMHDNVFKEKEIILLNQIYNASYLTMGFEHDWIYKDVCEKMLGETMAGVNDALNANKNVEVSNKSTDYTNYLLLGLSLAGAYFLWKTLKK